MAEWLRRWTWNPMGSPRAGSNPARSGRIFFELFYVTRNIALDFAGIRNGTKGKQGPGARKSKILHHSKYPCQFQSPITFYSSKVILYHVTVSVNDVHWSFPIIYDPVSWVKPLHKAFPCHLNLACNLLLIRIFNHQLPILIFLAIFMIKENVLVDRLEYIKCNSVWLHVSEGIG